MPTTLFRGETRLIERTLLNADGSALAVASLNSAVLRLIQGGSTVKSLTLGTNPELRQGTASNILEFELTSAISSLFSPDLVLSFRWELSVRNSGFTVQPNTAFIDYISEDLYTIA